MGYSATQACARLRRAWPGLSCRRPVGAESVPRFPAVRLAADEARSNWPGDAFWAFGWRKMLSSQQPACRLNLYLYGRYSIHISLFPTRCPLFASARSQLPTIFAVRLAALRLRRPTAHEPSAVRRELFPENRRPSQVKTGKRIHLNRKRSIVRVPAGALSAAGLEDGHAVVGSVVSLKSQEFRVDPRDPRLKNRGLVRRAGR